MFDRMPKILGITWPRPRPFWDQLFERSLGFPQMKLCTKFEVSSSSSFGDTFDRIPKILGVTWPRPRPFGGNFAYFYSSLPISSSVTNLKFEVSTFTICCFAAIIILSSVIYRRKWPLRMRCVTWPVGRGPVTTKNLETLTPICLFTIQLSGGYDDD